MTTEDPKRSRQMEGDTLPKAEETRVTNFRLDDLDVNICINVFKFLEPFEAARYSLINKHFAEVAGQPLLWRHFYESYLASDVRRGLLPPPDQIQNWRAAFIRGDMLGSIQYGAWERLQPGPTRPCPREGHAASSWGRDSLILFGGWGSGIRNDLFILDRVYDTNGHDGNGSGARASSGAAGSEAGEGWARGVGGAGRCPAMFPAAPAALPDAGAAGPSSGPRSSTSRGGGQQQQQQGGGASGSGGEQAGAAGGSGNGSGGGGAGGSGSRGPHAEPGNDSEPGPAAPWLTEEERPCGWRWRVPAVAGRKPAVRYGHSVTRCGPNRDWLVVYGGMQSGGYTAEISSLAILRPYSGNNDDSCKAAPYEYEWYHPELNGPDPGPRGYHAACASEDGRRLFLFGGMARHTSIAKLSVIDLDTWTVTRPATTGDTPSPRFGCSLLVYDNKLWVVGGGFGYDLARSGYDLYDIHVLDLATWEWSRMETTNQPHSNRVLGRCHASVLVGSKLLMFGGSLDLSNDITTLDLATRTWGRPAAVLGSPPGKRMSAVVALSRTDFLVFGGWIYASGEMGDLSRFRLLLTGEELARAKRVAAGKAGAAAAAAGGGGALQSAAAERDALQDALSTRLAQYYGLMRRAQELEESGDALPTALVRNMDDTMRAIRTLREGLRQAERDAAREAAAAVLAARRGGGGGGGHNANNGDSDEEDGEGEGGLEVDHIALLQHLFFMGGYGSDSEEEGEEGEGEEGSSDEEGSSSSEEGNGEGDEEDGEGVQVLAWDSDETGEEETDGGEEEGEEGAGEGASDGEDAQ